MTQQQRQIFDIKIIVETSAERNRNAPRIVGTTAPENRDPGELTLVQNLMYDQTYAEIHHEIEGGRYVPAEKKTFTGSLARFSVGGGHANQSFQIHSRTIFFTYAHPIKN